MIAGRLPILLLAALALLAGGCATQTPASRAFSFALMGDVQYTSYEQKQFPLLLDAISAEQLAFVVHIGDFKAGSDAPCTDQLYATRLAELNQSRHALVFTPGDNDWVDCRRASNGRDQPLERLQKIRQLFFATPFALGANPLPLLRQSAADAGDPVLRRYVENAMWEHNGVVFLTLNIQGSNDNLGFDTASDREHAERTRANIAWLKRATAKAREHDISGLAVFLQANPGFEQPPAQVRMSGFAEFLATFEDEARRLAKPVLFAHGDTHQFRVDRPYISPLDRQPVANVMRVETFGSPWFDWVRVSVDASSPDGMFRVSAGGYTPAKGSD